MAWDFPGASAVDAVGFLAPDRVVYDGPDDATGATTRHRGARRVHDRAGRLRCHQQRQPGAG